MKKKNSISTNKAKAEIRLIDAQTKATGLSSWYPYFRTIVTIVLPSLVLLFKPPSITFFEVLAAFSELLSIFAK